MLFALYPSVKFVCVFLHTCVVECISPYFPSTHLLPSHNSSIMAVHLSSIIASPRIASGWQYWRLTETCKARFHLHSVTIFNIQHTSSAPLTLLILIHDCTGSSSHPSCHLNPFLPLQTFFHLPFLCQSMKTFCHFLLQYNEHWYMPCALFCSVCSSAYSVFLSLVVISIYLKVKICFSQLKNEWSFVTVYENPDKPTWVCKNKSSGIVSFCN